MIGPGSDKNPQLKDMFTGTSNDQSLLVVSNFELPEYSFEVYREGHMEG